MKFPKKFPYNLFKLKSKWWVVLASSKTALKIEFHLQPPCLLVRSECLIIGQEGVL